ncbi:unnamed protein product [Owenia fusiformis]|uniref:Uncharacterized protein n=1 Tax=Owenia fusiformis TaxID=6347 RepID=A0A8S4PUR5_OWEFU|nr:unnamed protein product [Owenia fusiformis]
MELPTTQAKGVPVHKKQNVKQQVKVVMGGLENVLGDLKTVVGDIGDLVHQIDSVTERINEQYGIDITKQGTIDTNAKRTRLQISPSRHEMKKKGKMKQIAFAEPTYYQDFIEEQQRKKSPSIGGSQEFDFGNQTWDNEDYEWNFLSADEMKIASGSSPGLSMELEIMQQQSFINKLRERLSDDEEGHVVHSNKDQPGISSHINSIDSSMEYIFSDSSLATQPNNSLNKIDPQYHKESNPKKPVTLSPQTKSYPRAMTPKSTLSSTSSGVSEKNSEYSGVYEKDLESKLEGYDTIDTWDSADSVDKAGISDVESDVISISKDYELDYDTDICPWKSYSITFVEANSPSEHKNVLDTRSLDNNLNDITKHPCLKNILEYTTNGKAFGDIGNDIEEDMDISGETSPVKDVKTLTESSSSKETTSASIESCILTDPNLNTTHPKSPEKVTNVSSTDFSGDPPTDINVNYPTLASNEQSFDIVADSTGSDVQLSPNGNTLERKRRNHSNQGSCKDELDNHLGNIPVNIQSNIVD